MSRHASPEFSNDYEHQQHFRRHLAADAPAEPDTGIWRPSSSFFADWPAEDYPEAVENCLRHLREYIPKRNLSRSHRWSARQAIAQARYLGLGRAKR